MESMTIWKRIRLSKLLGWMLFFDVIKVGATYAMSHFGILNNIFKIIGADINNWQQFLIVYGVLTFLFIFISHFNTNFCSAYEHNIFDTLKYIIPYLIVLFVTYRIASISSYEKWGSIAFNIECFIPVGIDILLLTINHFRYDGKRIKEEKADISDRNYLRTLSPELREQELKRREIEKKRIYEELMEQNAEAFKRAEEYKNSEEYAEFLEKQRQKKEQRRKEWDELFDISSNDKHTSVFGNIAWDTINSEEERRRKEEEDLWNRQRQEQERFLREEYYHRPSNYDD